METPSQHLHTLKIAVLDPAGAEGGYSVDRVKEVLGAHLDRLPAFRRRLVPTPLSVHHPVWIDDRDFDINAHVRAVNVGAPGNQEQLDAVVSEIAGRPLDRGRPLWELWVVEGLENGYVGFVAKIHHSVADGVKAAEMLMQVLGPDPRAPVPEAAGSEWRGEPVPPASLLLRSALVDLLHDLRRLPLLLVRTLGGIARLVRRRRAGHDAAPAPFATVNTPFNRALTPERLFVSTSLPLGDVKAVRQALGATVNDVVVAVCAGALRSWLPGGPADRPLIAGVPVSTRDEFKVGRANSVSNLFTALPVNVADPVARVAAVRRSMAAAKEQHRLLGPEVLEEWSQLTPPALFGAVVRLYSRLDLANRHRPPINLVVSNVPGPDRPLFVSGARLVGIWSMGPILENIGLNITVWSYIDQLNFGLVACPDSVPDLRALADHLHDSLDELLKAVA